MGYAENDPAAQSEFSTFRGALAKLGWTEGSNVRIEVRWADADDPGAVARLADENTRLVFGETVGNPKLNVLDVPAWAEAAHAAGLPLILDNTIPTPVGARVFEQGADVAVQ